jgi:26S proteasome regulatory subunit N2
LRAIGIPLTTLHARSFSTPPLHTQQVFYHLGELDDALTYALAAGTLFDVEDAGDYTQAVLGAFFFFFFFSFEDSDTRSGASNVLWRGGRRRGSGRGATCSAAQAEAGVCWIACVGQSGVVPHCAPVLAAALTLRHRTFSLTLRPSTTSTLPPPLFPSPHTQTAKCIDSYIAQRTSPDAPPADPRLNALVERLFDGCCAAGRFEAAVGVALEARRLDKLQQAVVSAGPAGGPAVAAYALRAARTLVSDRAFREQVMRLLVGLAEDGATEAAGGVAGAAAAGTDWPAVAQCLAALGDAPALASLLDRLLRAGVAGGPGGEEAGLLALQVGFDIAANEDAPFAGRVLAALEEKAPKAPKAEPVAGAESDASAATAPAPPALSPADAAYRTRLDALARALDGSAASSLSLAFLHARCAADPGVLAAARSAVEPRNSLCHGAVVFANAAMHAGTTVDTFLRSNLEWLARATNWAKFSATAGLGSIHRGHTGRARALMAPYLPRGSGGSGGSASSYSEGGALFAVGLIHAGLGTAPRTRSAPGASPTDPSDAAFLLDALRSATAEPVQHGAALGLGAALLGSADPAAYEALKDLLYADAAVAGEGAGLGVGLLCAGAGPAHAAELVAYARDTQHEKIIRGCAVGAALTVLGTEQGADTLIEDLCADADPILRYGGMFAAGLAYAGTGHPAAIARLLHAAVSDVSDDVRRGAVTALGFALCSSPESVPRLVALLAESFNPHVRYGAAMALGVACAATGSRAAMDVLDPLLGDATDFVRQGAALAAALVNQQQPAAVTAPLRASLAKAGADKHEEVMGRVGAIMAAGILDAGGRNAAIGSLRSPGSGALRVPAVAGLALFCQYWHWHPLAYFLPLALAPSALIGVEPASLRPPAGVGLVCECRPSLFAHPPPVSPAGSGADAGGGPRAPTAVLSTTARAAALAKKKAAEDKAAAAAAAMETDEKAKAKAAGGGEEEEGAKKEGAEDAAPAEPSSYKLDNPCRVAPGQARFIRYDKASRWVPAVGSGVPGRKERVTGVVVLRDRAPGEPVEWALPGDGGGAAAAAPAAAGAAPAADAGEEPAPPAAIDMATE